MVMKYGCAHVGGLYTVPALSGTQLQDGADVIHSVLSAGQGRTLKLYLTGAPATDYPLQTSLAAVVPASLTALIQRSEYVNAIALGWDTVILTCFTVANGRTNWWRLGPTNAQLAAERAELQALTEYLRTTYAGSGMTFIIQQWEGDWAFMDATDPDTSVARVIVDYYSSFLNARQKAVRDGCIAEPSDVAVLCAVEVNRVVDARLYPHRRRILNDLAGKIRPDIISYSAYDSTIVQQGSWGADQAAWEAATEPVLRQALHTIQKAFPGVPIYIGEFGFPENEATNDHPLNDVGEMIGLVERVCREEGVKYLIYWQVFDNEQSVPYTYRGYWFRKDDDSATLASAAMGAFTGV